jgi:aminopeptidase N
VAIPVALGLVAEDGTSLNASCSRVSPGGVFLFDRASDSLTFTDVARRPVPSLFRGFSAPVRVSLDLQNEDLLALLRHDGDPFNRWQAAQTVGMRLLVGLSAGANVDPAEIDGLAAALVAFLEGEALNDPAFASLVLTLPSDTDVAQEIGRDVDPDRIHQARRALRQRVGERCLERLVLLRGELAPEDAYSPDAASAGRRSLRNAALDLIAAADPARGEALAVAQFDEAGSMTDRLAGLATLTTLPGAAREAALQRFGERYRDEPLVLDKWFTLQAAIAEPGTLDRVRGLMRHPAFALSNPNRVRALIGSFAMMNPTQFNRPDGSGYDFLADIVTGIDPSNPQLAARLATAFGSWRMLDAPRRAQAEKALRRIAEKPNLSRDLEDIAQRALT